MDDIVKAAMAKWPHVPDCYGWLGLDARGHWYVRDLAAQQAGPFSGAGATPRSKGTRLLHDKLIAFIGRNYASDDRGCRYFQNGPQRVYVELEAAPWVWRLTPQGQLSSHTERPAVFRAAYVDETGRLFIETDLGLGLLHTQDVHLAADRIESGLWPLEENDWRGLLARCGVVPSPLALSVA